MVSDGRHLDSVHPVAAAGFAAAPERYEAGRPGYPDAAVSWLCERLGIREGAVVADVAAGTGKLTRALVGSGARLIAVEPVSAMAEMLRSLTPGVEVASATAEALPFADGSIDAITAGQAFHWFDAGLAWTEFRRVLRRDGGVGLVWNVCDRSVDWVDRVWSILDEVEKKAPWRDHDRTSPKAGAGFSPMESATLWHDVSLTRQAMLDRIASVSHVAVLPEPERNAVLARVAAELPAGETLEIRYRVDTFVTHKQ